MKRLANYFFQGLVYLAPIAFTLWVFVATFRFIDGILDLPIPGIGALLLVGFTTMFGFLLSNFLARRVLDLFEDVLDRLPLARLLHGSVKDLMSAFVGEKRRFKHPVAVELIPGSGVRALGFVTRDSMVDWGLGDQVAVYFPQSYNFAGQLVLVPRERIVSISADSADVMTFIVSGGVSSGASRVDLPAAHGG